MPPERPAKEVEAAIESHQVEEIAVLADRRVDPFARRRCLLWS
jgi:hypothetical protein